MLKDDAILHGTLHVFVAFDWGDELDLDAARRLLPAESQDLARRRRTPSSIAYRPAPLRYPLMMPPVDLPELGAVSAVAEAIVFDFGGISVSLQIPFELSCAALSRLAGFLSDPQPLVEAARSACSGLFEQLKPAIQQAAWSPLGEEYFVFQLPPDHQLQEPAKLLDENAAWLAGLVRLESESLSRDEIDLALQSHISYSPHDLLLAAWSAAVLVDRDCEETLQAIEFANLQLLEFRYIDNLLDERLAAAYSTIHRTLRGACLFGERRPGHCGAWANYGSTQTICSNAPATHSKWLAISTWPVFIAWSLSDFIWVNGNKASEVRSMLSKELIR